jgi:phage-related protein
MAKPVVFHGGSLGDLREFPEAARRRTGYQLRRVQDGLDPLDWKPMTAIGKGVREIRVSDDTGAYRAICLMTLPDAVHVYHVFQKKTQKTAQHDLEIARKRYQEHMQSLK